MRIQLHKISRVLCLHLVTYVCYSYVLFTSLYGNSNLQMYGNANLMYCLNFIFYFGIKLFYFDIKQIYHFCCCFIVYDTRYPIIVFCKPSSISYTPLLSCSVKCQCNIKSLVKILCVHEAVVYYGN